MNTKRMRNVLIVIILLICVISIVALLFPNIMTRVHYNDPYKRVLLYQKALVDIINYDKDLMPGSKKIGVCFSRMNISSDDKQSVLEYLNKCCPIEVVEYQLSKKPSDGVFWCEIYFDGFKDGCVVIWSTSFGGQLGGAGYKGYYQYRNNHWALVKQKYGWLS